MSSFTILAILAVAGIVAFFIGRLRSIQVRDGHQQELHSRPSYYGYYLAILTALPAVVLLGGLECGGAACNQIRRHAGAAADGSSGTDAEKALFMSVVDNIAGVAAET